VGDASAACRGESGNGWSTTPAEAGAAISTGRRALSICLVTPGYLASTPRVVKEADALEAAGYRVRVVFSEGELDVLREHDCLLLRGKPWRSASVKWSRRRRGERSVLWRATLRYQLARRAPRGLWPMWALAERGEGRLYPELAALAGAEPADLFIGHYPVGLAAAALAASAQRARLGYDAEDLHTAEDASTRAGLLRRQRIDSIERKYLGRCVHVTAAAPRIAEALAKRYGIVSPVVVHNAFAWADRDRLDGKTVDRQGPALSLSWFSQTIGLDRGIGDAIRAAGVLGHPVQIHLRGGLSEPARQALLSMARTSGRGIAERLYFHQPVSPTELLSRTAEHDVGLALEQGHTHNYELTVTNKLFLSLLAGLAVAATDVPGQRDVLAACPEAGFLYQPGDWRTLAARLDSWIRRPEQLRASRNAALVAAQTRWNWERESEKLLESVAAAFARIPGDMKSLAPRVG
jgi:glycosyltransferase involved in cell wall biosynthesis